MSLPQPILLVEDNPMDLDLTLRAFRRHKLTNPVVVARDGVEALAHMQQWEAGEPVPLLILLDLKLPKVNGLEVLQQLKQHERFKAIPVVVLTSSQEDIDVQTAYEYGANAYIVKPVNFDNFTKVVEQINVFWLLANTPPRI